MPELPEVEVTRSKLVAQLLGRRIAKARTTPASYFFRTPPSRLRRCLPGRYACELRRQGKYLIAELDDASALVLHLGMTGQLFFEGASSLRLLASNSRAALSPEQQPTFVPDQHTHFIVEFEDGGPRLFFRDVRKFGKVHLLDPGQCDPRLSKLGVDALSRAGGTRLFEACSERRVPVKTVLLNQQVLTGVGNIYADEALFAAHIDPRRPARTLCEDECRRIARELRRVLRRAIETGGSSVRDYVSPDGRDGRYQDERRVYARTAQPCFRCGAPIQRIVLGQRATHWCPHCQR